MARCKHDWALYADPEMDEQLGAIRLIEEERYYVHGDTGHNRRHCLDVTFSGASLTAAQRAANLATGGKRMKVQWMYKEG